MPLTPKNRKEEWLEGLVQHSTTLTPKNRPEEWMLGLIEGSTTLTPKNRCEAWLKEIIDASGGGGGGSLEIEEGLWSPEEDIARPTISFSDDHATLPGLVIISDDNDTAVSSGSNLFWMLGSPYNFWSASPLVSTTIYYGRVDFLYNLGGTVNANGYIITELTGVSSSSMEYWVTTSDFSPYWLGPSRYWRAGRTYKWIAVWKPE